jgi:hypothetical protein
MATLTLNLNEGYNIPQLGQILWTSAPSGSMVMVEHGDADCFNGYFKVTNRQAEVVDRIRDALADGKLAIGPEWNGGTTLYFYTTSDNGNIHHHYYGVQPAIFHDLFAK